MTEPAQQRTFQNRCLRDISWLPSHLAHQPPLLISHQLRDDESKTQTNLSYILTMCKLQLSDFSCLGLSWLL